MKTDKPEETVTNPSPSNTEPVLRSSQFRQRTLIAGSIMGLATIALIIVILMSPGGFYSTLLASLAGLVAVLFFLWQIPKWQVEPYRAKLRPKDQVELEIQARSTLIQIIGGVAVVGSVYFTARNLTLTAENLSLTAKSVESAESSAKNAIELARLTQLTERYATAVKQLEGKDLEERLAGIYALDILASQKESPAFHRPIILVLASHVRTKSPRLPPAADGSETQTEPIARDVQEILTVIGRNNINGEDGAIDLSGTYLRGADMHGGKFERVNFSGSFLAGANFNKATLNEIDLSGADLTEASFEDAEIKSARFERAQLISTSFKRAKLGGSKLNLAKLVGIVCDDANLTNVEFDQVEEFKEGYFSGADLSGARGFTCEWFQELKNLGRINDKTLLPDAEFIKRCDQGGLTATTG